MKKIIIPFFLIWAATAVSCRKQVPSGCLKVKIIRITCASTVMQALDNNSVGTDGWPDIYGNNAIYDNVFVANSSCQIPAEYKVGDLVYVKTATPTKEDCIRCALYDAPPKVSYDIKSIGNLPCNGDAKF